ncbi:hypothetical protein [Kitasatospora sp. NBC_01539]|uniref:hypothetical protein n=1 Tax=Kitasatospora sp. NBC_01539 TaxID=2903577 RepID=UPI0038600B66
MATDVVARARRTWRRLGVAPPVAAEMAEELTADLAAAAADGRSAAEYVGGDPAALARTWADERGVVRARLRLVRVGTAALAGALPGGFTGLFWVFAPGSALPGFVSAGAAGAGWTGPPTGVLLALYLAGAVAAYAGAVAAVHAVLGHGDDPARRPTVRALAALLPVVGLSAAAAGIGLAAVLDFRHTAFVPVCLVVLSVVGGGAAAVRAGVVVRGRAAGAVPAG